MRKWLVPIFAVAGFVATILILPNTRWVVLTQWDVLMGRWEYNNGAGLSNEFGPWLEPDEGFIDPGPGKDGEFVNLITPRRSQPPAEQMPFEKRIQCLYSLVAVENRADYWAQFVRVASQVANVTRLRGRKPSAEQLAERDRTRELLLKGCVAGEKLDPDNAFFPLVASAALHTLDRLPEARQALLRASTARNCDAYLDLEPTLRLANFERNYNYRGERIRAWTLANVLFYHMAAIRSLTGEYAKSTDPELRAAVARVGDLIMRRDDTVIGLHVGRSIFVSGIRGKSEDSAVPAPIKPEEVTALSAKLEKAVPGEQGIVKAGEAYNKLTPLLREDWMPPREDSQVLFSLSPAFSGWSLGWLLVLVPLSGLAWLKSRSDRFAAASPHLAWLLAMPLEPAAGVDQILLTVGVAAFLFVPALFERTRKTADVLGLLMAAITFYLAITESKLLLPLSFFLISLALTRKWRLPDILGGVATVIAAGVAAALWTMIAIGQGWENGLFFGFIAMVGASALAMPGNRVSEGSPGRFMVGTAVAVTIAGVWYAGTVFRDLSANVRVAAAAEALTHEAERIRRESGAFN